MTQNLKQVQPPRISVSGFHLNFSSSGPEDVEPLHHQLFNALPPFARGWLRAIQHFYQRRTRGWDDTELWNLDKTLARWLGERLLVMSEDSYGCPAQYLVEYGEDECMIRWSGELKSCANSLLAWEDDDSYSMEDEQRAAEQAEEAMRWVAKNFLSLWT